MTVPVYHWTRVPIGRGEDHLTAEGVDGVLASVLSIVSLKPREKAGAFIEIPGWTGEKSSYHETWADAKIAATAVVGPYVLEQLDAKEAAEKEAAAVLRAKVREEIRAGLNSALCNGGHPEAETGWSPSAEVDKTTDAVMALLNGDNA